MIELNLLPDVKMQFIKARRLKRIAISLSAIIGGAFLVIFILLFLFVDVAQKVRINNLKDNISGLEHQMHADTDLNKILTIQQQLNALPTIENQSPTASRLFGYLTQIVPTNVTISNMNIDFSGNTITITGSADSLNTVSQLVDTLKFTTFNNGSSTGNPAFNTVDLSSFGYNSISGQPSTSSSYSLSFNFDTAIFNPADNINLVVPNETTTRSVLDSPSILFKANPK